MKEYSSKVVIVGGGATGVGILRDLSMRGIPALLFEKGDLAHGTSSRFHGLLHSGARYAVKDRESAVECAQENAILRRIAPNCIEETSGWFVQMSEDDPNYAQIWLEGCKEAGIPVKEIPAAEARLLEPLIGKDVLRVFEVPDAAVDGFKLIWENAESSQRYGGKFETYHVVQKLLMEGTRVVGVEGLDSITGESFRAYGDIVVNAAGPWASEIAKTAGSEVNVVCDKGALIAFNQRLFNRVINRLRIPGDADIFVPHETITILGTTSKTVESPEMNHPLEQEIEKLIQIGKGVFPDLESYRVIRAFAGVRPLYEEEHHEGEAGRSISRNFILLDHEKRDGIQGFVSIVGGKFTTYRLMAERVTDWVCQQLGGEEICRTGDEPLRLSACDNTLAMAQKLLPCGAAEKMLQRLGEQAIQVLKEIEVEPELGQMICECEMVTRGEVRWAAMHPHTHHLSDVRRKTRMGMGTCQGAFCTFRAIPILFSAKQKELDIHLEIKSFLNQRWKGICPVLWGQQLRETELTRGIYSATLGLNS